LGSAEARRRAVRSAWKSRAMCGSSGYVAGLLLDIEYLDVEKLAIEIP
jgi:hypothetical protein